MQRLLAKWQICESQAKDTIDIGQTDAPMATMMLGQTDDNFKAVDTDFQDLSAAISYTASNMSTQLYSDAEWTESVVIIHNACRFSDQHFRRRGSRSIDRQAHKVHYRCDATPLGR